MISLDGLNGDQTLSVARMMPTSLFHTKVGLFESFRLWDLQTAAWLTSGRPEELPRFVHRRNEYLHHLRTMGDDGTPGHAAGHAMSRWEAPGGAGSLSEVHPYSAQSHDLENWLEANFTVREGLADLIRAGDMGMYLLVVGRERYGDDQMVIPEEVVVLHSLRHAVIASGTSMDIANDLGLLREQLWVAFPQPALRWDEEVEGA